jgi:hypothetical protein
VQPRNHGPGLRITRAYRNYRADRVLGRGHTGVRVDPNTPGDSLEEIHTGKPGDVGTSRGGVEPDMWTTRAGVDAESGMCRSVVHNARPGPLVP